MSCAPTRGRESHQTFRSRVPDLIKCYQISVNAPILTIAALNSLNTSLEACLFLWILGISNTSLGRVPALLVWLGVKSRFNQGCRYDKGTRFAGSFFFAELLKEMPFNIGLFAFHCEWRWGSRYHKQTWFGSFCSANKKKFQKGNQTKFGIFF